MELFRKNYRKKKPCLQEVTRGYVYAVLYWRAPRLLSYADEFVHYVLENHKTKYTGGQRVTDMSAKLCKYCCFITQFFAQILAHSL